MKNLILGTAVHSDLNRLVPFVSSCKKFCPDSHLALVVAPNESAEVIEYLKQNNVQLIYFVSFFFIPTRIHNTRYMRYLEFLLENQFDQILLTDVTDVVFQGNPFEPRLSDGLHIFQEDDRYTCGTEDHNSSWLMANYGAEVLSQMKDAPIYCSGTILGSYAEVLHFLTLLLQERSPQKFIELGGREDDQGPFNYLIHFRKMDFRPHKNTDIVGTLILTDDSKIQINGDWVEINGVRPSILHQYVKKPKLLEHFNRLYNKMET
jgi:hypothetical protein